jgi:hypothetical protein
LDIPENEYEHQDLKAGTDCQIQYLREGCLHIFKTEILGVMNLSNAINFLAIQFPKHIRSQNLRSFPRIRLQDPARISNQMGESWSCRFLDLGLGGCQIDIREARFEVGDQLYLSCMLSDKNLLDVPCVVKRLYKDHKYGLEFQHLNQANKKALEDFLKSLAAYQFIEGDENIQHGMLGDLSEIFLPDLLQILVNNPNSYQVDITNESAWGRVYLKGGQVSYAKTSNQEGQNAIFEMFSWSKGGFRIQKAEWIPDCNIHEQLEHLLLEFAFHQDESSMNEDLVLFEA